MGASWASRQTEGEGGHISLRCGLLVVKRERAWEWGVSSPRTGGEDDKVEERGGGGDVDGHGGAPRAEDSDDGFDGVVVEFCSGVRWVERSGTVQGMGSARGECVEGTVQERMSVSGSEW